MFTLIAAMAELERSIIHERVLAGLEHANRNGTRSGRPVGRPKVVLDQERIRQPRMRTNCLGRKSPGEFTPATAACAGPTRRPARTRWPAKTPWRRSYERSNLMFSALRLAN
jgi:hypothetical protein